MTVSRLVSLIKYGLVVLQKHGLVEFTKRTIRFMRNYLSRRRFLRAPEITSAQIPQRHGLLFTFVIPVFDRTWELREAIESVLAQSLPNIELIIVCDGSPPATRAVIAEYSKDSRVRVFSYPHPSGNAVRGRNKGILEARGAFVAFLDSDDTALPDRAALALQEFETGADVVYGAWIARVDGSRTTADLVDGQYVFSPGIENANIVSLNVLCQSTVSVRRSCFDESGFFKPIMRYKEDHEMWARLAHAGRTFRALSTPISTLRIHEGNNELNFKSEEKYWQSLLEKQFYFPGPFTKKIVFVLPGIGVSGGIAVVFRHANMLLNSGHDVSIINAGHNFDTSWYGSIDFPIFSLDDVARCPDIISNIDMIFATGWTTADFLRKIPAKRSLYFVQSDERRFVDDESTKSIIAETYRMPCEYISEAKWVIDMLRAEFGQLAHYIPNGIDLTTFHPSNDKSESRRRVLIEGPIDIPFKGMADAYAAVADIECERWIVSAAGKPLASWKYDRFFEAVPMAEMRTIYSSCDVMLKMSKVEGFYGPPMEAMACGCAVVTSKVTGYNEYIIDGENALVVDAGDVIGAHTAVERLLDDESLRRKLVEGGYRTVRNWSWEQSHQAMLRVVMSSQIN